jgi:NhaA family Na+:H+ antiporter
MIPIRPKFETRACIARVRESAENMDEAVADNPDIINNNRLRSLVISPRDGVMLAQARAQRAEHALHMPVAYLVIPMFALANAGIPIDLACLGGNGTLVGATANIIVAGFAGRAGHPISFARFLLIGVPVLLLSVMIAAGYLYLRHFS